MPDWVQGWQQVQPLTDKSIDLLTRSLGNLSNAWQGLGNSGINYLQREIDRRDLIDAKNKASNTQLILSKLNQADTLEDKERLLNAGYADFGAIRSMLNNGDFDERVVNDNLAKWDAGITQRFMANDNLKLSTPEGQKAYIDYMRAVGKGNQEEILRTGSNPYLPLSLQAQAGNVAMGRGDLAYNRAFTEQQYKDQQEKADEIRKIYEDSAKDRNNLNIQNSLVNAFSNFNQADMVKNSREGAVVNALNDIAIKYGFNNVAVAFNNASSKDPIIIGRFDKFYKDFLTYSNDLGTDEKQNVYNAMKAGLSGSLSQIQGFNVDNFFNSLRTGLRVQDFDINTNQLISNTNTNVGSENQTTTTTTPTVSDTPERQAILNNINERKKHLEDVKQQKAKGFTKPTKYFKTEQERNKHYDDYASKVEKEITDAENKLKEFDAKQNQTTNNQITITELSKEDKEKIADIRKQILNLKDDNTLSTEGKNAKAYELNQQIEDIVAKTYPKKEEGVVNNYAPTTNTATNTDVNSGSNENLIAKSSEPEIDEKEQFMYSALNPAPSTNTNTNTTIPTNNTSEENSNKDTSTNDNLTWEDLEKEKDKEDEELRNLIKERNKYSKEVIANSNFKTREERIAYQNAVYKRNEINNKILEKSGKTSEIIFEENSVVNREVSSTLSADNNVSYREFQTNTNLNKYAHRILDKLIEKHKDNPKYKKFLENKKNQLPLVATQIDSLNGVNISNNKDATTEDNKIITEKMQTSIEDLDKQLTEMFKLSEEIKDTMEDEVLNSSLPARSNAKTVSGSNKDSKYQLNFKSLMDTVSDDNYKSPFDNFGYSVNQIQTGFKNYEKGNESFVNQLLSQVENKANKEFNWFFGLRDKSDDIARNFHKALSKVEREDKETFKLVFDMGVELIATAKNEKELHSRMSALSDLNISGLKTYRDNLKIIDNLIPSSSLFLDGYSNGRVSQSFINTLPKGIIQELYKRRKQGTDKNNLNSYLQRVIEEEKEKQARIEREYEKYAIFYF